MQGRRNKERKKARGTKQETEREIVREEVQVGSWDMANGWKKGRVLGGGNGSGG